MSQQMPELAGSGYFDFNPDVERQIQDEKREQLIRKFLPLAAATWQDPDVYARFMTEYVGDSNPIIRGLGARPPMVRRRHGVETDYPCEMFSGASLEGDLLHVRAAVWAQDIEDYRAVFSDGLKPASDHRLIRFIINPSEKRTLRDDKGNVIESDSFSMRLRMMDGMATRILAPTQVPGSERQWILQVSGKISEPEKREAELFTPKRTISFYPIDALHEAILRVGRRGAAPPEDGLDSNERHLTLVHSDNWAKNMTQ
jgi:hypothetical protein